MGCVRTGLITVEHGKRQGIDDFLDHAIPAALTAAADKSEVSQFNTTSR